MSTRSLVHLDIRDASTNSSTARKRILEVQTKQANSLGAELEWRDTQYSLEIRIYEDRPMSFLRKPLGHRAADDAQREAETLLEGHLVAEPDDRGEHPNDRFDRTEHLHGGPVYRRRLACSLQFAHFGAFRNIGDGGRRSVFKTQ